MVCHFMASGVYIRDWQNKKNRFVRQIKQAVCWAPLLYFLLLFVQFHRIYFPQHKSTAALHIDPQ